MKPALPEPSGRIPGRRLLHSPGPTPVPEEVLWAMSRQPMDLGDRRGDETIAACEAGLRRLLQTDAAEVFLYASNGHGVWEAVVENLLPLGGTALVPGTGHFSESWAEQTEALGRRVLRTPWVAGRPIDLSALAQALRDDTLRVTMGAAARRAALERFNWDRVVRDTIDFAAQCVDRTRTLT